MKSILHKFFLFVLATVSCFTILGWLGNNWIFDLFSHFLPQYAIIAFCTTIYFVFSKKWKLVLFASLCLVYNAKDLLPFYTGKAHSFEEKGLKLCSLNLLSSNGEFKKVYEYIANEDPDILVLQELTDLWLIALDSGLNEFDWKHSIPRADNFGIGIYSKRPLTDLDILNLNEFSLPSILASVDYQGKVIKLLATHPLPPVGQTQFESRNNQFRQIANWINTQKEPLVIIGDLNSSSFSRHFKRLINDTGLFDSRNGFGVQNSWPSNMAVFRTALDHCLLTTDFVVQERSVGQNIGSDHLPISIQISLKD